jgi:hypothetical protein
MGRESFSLRLCAAIGLNRLLQFFTLLLHFLVAFNFASNVLALREQG